MKKAKIRKLEKKRKAEREKRKQKPLSLGYHGRKYQTESLMPLLLQTETAIYEAFVISERSLTDHDVGKALEQLILRIRKGQLDMEASDLGLSSEAGGDVDGFLTWNILQHWHMELKNGPGPGRDNLIGVLRTVLGSVENHSNVSPTSREYLKFIEKMLKEIGVHVQKVPADAKVFSPPGELQGSHFHLRDSADADEVEETFEESNG